MAEGTPAWIAALRADPDVTRLVRALALSDRFHVFLLLCDTPRVAQAVFDVLAEEVPAEREEEVRFVWLEPYDAHTDISQPIPFELLAEQILARLVAPAPEERSADVVFVVDGSRALPLDDGAWSLLFQRMNERRNVIARQLAGPLLLCMPPRLEPVFAHAAPDFWSIRSLAVVVEAAPEDEVATRSVLQWLYEHVERVPRNAPTRDPVEIQDKVDALREFVSSHPDDENAASALWSALLEQGRDALGGGRLEDALTAANEGADLGRRLLEADPTRDWKLAWLAGSLRMLGVISQSRGDLARARDAYEEYIELFRQLIQAHPERLDYVAHLSEALDRLGRVHEDGGDLDQAFKVEEESVSLWRRVLETDPERPDYLHGLATRLMRLGDLYKKRHDVEYACRSYEASLPMLRPLVARYPDHWEFLRDLAMNLADLGGVYTEIGQIERARELCEEALERAGRLMELAPDQPDWWTPAFYSLMRLGDLHLARGDVARARDAFERGIALAHRYVDPFYHHLHLWVSLTGRAKVAEKEGRPDEELTYARQALAEVDTLLGHGGAPAKLAKTIEASRERVARLEAAVTPTSRSTAARRSADHQ